MCSAVRARSHHTPHLTHRCAVSFEIPSDRRQVKSDCSCSEREKARKKLRDCALREAGSVRMVVGEGLDDRAKLIDGSARRIGGPHADDPLEFGLERVVSGVTVSHGSVAQTRQ